MNGRIIHIKKCLKERYNAIFGKHVKEKENELQGEEIKGAGESKREKKVGFINIWKYIFFNELVLFSIFMQWKLAAPTSVLYEIHASLWIFRWYNKNI